MDGVSEVRIAHGPENCGLGALSRANSTLQLVDSRLQVPIHRLRVLDCRRPRLTSHAIWPEPIHDPLADTHCRPTTNSEYNRK